jgi:hypothetical protein
MPRASRLSRSARSAAKTSVDVRAAVAVTAAAVGGDVVRDDVVVVQEHAEEDLLAAGDVSGLQKRLKFVDVAANSVTAAVCVTVEVQKLRQLASLACCPACDSACTLSEDTTKVLCTVCDDVVLSLSRSPIARLDGSITRRDPDKTCRVYDSIVSGGGFSGFLSTYRNVGHESLSKPHYHGYCRFLFNEMTSLWDQHRRQLQDSMRRALQDLDVLPPADGILELDVSYDGTWMTRGYKSHICVGFVIDVTHGFVLDFEVISNFCQECVKMKKRMTEEQFAEWKETHKERCMQNFKGKSGAMEVEAALRLWQRSEALGYRYTGFISDGDSASFNAVSALNDGAGPYVSATVSKMECVNHVAKRMGTRLRQLKKNHRVPTRTKTTGKTIMRSVLGGRDGLTDAAIDRITAHYGQCIRNQQPGDTVSDLRDRILAIYYHASSTDEEPRHQHCPAGEASWCFYQKALATDVTPASHTTKNLYLSGLSRDLRSLVLRVFVDLSSSPLLQRCLQAHTQNRNESLHSKLWLKCLKVKHAYLQRVVFAASVTALQHNIGPARGNLLTVLGLTTDVHLQKRKIEEQTPRKIPTRKRKRPAAEEPSTSYAPGGF